MRQKRTNIIPNAQFYYQYLYSVQAAHYLQTKTWSEAAVVIVDELWRICFPKCWWCGRIFCSLNKWLQFFGWEATCIRWSANHQSIGSLNNPQLTRCLGIICFCILLWSSLETALLLLSQALKFGLHLFRKIWAIHHVSSLVIPHAFKNSLSLGRKADCLLGQFILWHVLAEETTESDLAYLRRACPSSWCCHILIRCYEDFDAVGSEEVVNWIKECAV